MPTIEIQGLPARRRDVLRLIMNGLSTKEIARLMGISTYTVEDQRFAIMCAARAKNMCEAITNLVASGAIKIVPMLAICALLLGTDDQSRPVRPYRATSIVRVMGRV